MLTDIDHGSCVQIADFGLSVKMNYMQSHISNHKAGTPFYMAPEVVQHGVLSKRADIFSYGVVLWEIYHQSCPIQTAGGNGNLQYHEKFPKFPVSCPMLYALLCVVCLSPSPEDRPDFEFVIRVLKAIRSSIDNVSTDQGSGTFSFETYIYTTWLSRLFLCNSHSKCTHF